jgi:hypothetical protein
VVAGREDVGERDEVVLELVAGSPGTFRALKSANGTRT